MEYGRYVGREGGRMRFRYPARELSSILVKIFKMSVHVL